MLIFPLRLSTTLNRIISQEGYPPAIRDTKNSRETASTVKPGFQSMDNKELRNWSNPWMAWRNTFKKSKERTKAMKQTSRLSIHNWANSFQRAAPRHFLTPISLLLVNAPARLILIKLKLDQKTIKEIRIIHFNLCFSKVYLTFAVRKNTNMIKKLQMLNNIHARSMKLELYNVEKKVMKVERL